METNMITDRESLTNEQLKLFRNIPANILYAYIRQELNTILNCIKDGIFITDGEGNVLTLNKASEDLCVYSAEEMIGRNIRDLIIDGYFPEDEVSTLLAIESKREVNLIQRGKGDKYDILVTSIPYIENGKVIRVVSTERDITELTRLEEMLIMNRELAFKYKKELEYYREKNIEIAKGIVYKSNKMKNIIMLAKKVARSDVTVLIQGESGVGKEVIAKLIHQSSNRKDNPYIKINCAAIPEKLLESELYGYEKGAFTGANEKGKVGIFELANGGTLFLDEIGSFPIHLQSKLLRSIHEKEIMRIGGAKYIPLNVRIIAATNTNLKEAVDKKLFREDLFYRLNVIPLTIAPLRERRSDIYPLAQHFLKIFNEKYHTIKTIEENAWPLLTKYKWPGNVRELENIIERLVITSRENIISKDEVRNQFSGLGVENVTFEDINNIGLKDAVRRYEKKLIEENLPLYNRSQDLADALKIDKSTLTRKMKKYKIKNIYIEE
jgi:PAS domain S-box-containing protein